MKSQLLLSICMALIIGLPSCKKDPCKDVVCYNDGVCLNGECSCTEGYMGPACETQQTPSLIRISQVRVHDFPPTDGGAGWDLSSGADIYVEIYKGTTRLWQSPDFRQNADPNTTHTWIVSGLIDLTDANAQYEIHLFDYDDFDPDDHMGGLIFVPYDNQGGFPETLVIKNGPIHFELDVSYTF